MRITPLDIRKQEFRKAMRGLDAEEVYAFLSTVGDEYESISFRLYQEMIRQQSKHKKIAINELSD